MKRWLNVAKSLGGDAFIPMARHWLRPMDTMRGLPMILKEDLKDADWSMAVSQFVTGG